MRSRCKHENCEITMVMESFVEMEVISGSLILISDSTDSPEFKRYEVLCNDCGLAKRYTDPPKWLIKRLDQEFDKEALNKYIGGNPLLKNRTPYDHEDCPFCDGSGEIVTADGENLPCGYNPLFGEK